MRGVTLNNIKSTYDSYQQLISLYNEKKGLLLETIDISLDQWFDANLCSAFGGILDSLQFGLNDINFNYIKPEIKTIIQKNGFLSHYGFEKIIDINRTTVEYLKLKKSDGRYFQQYVFSELLNRQELPEMTAELKKKITESIYEMFVNAQTHSETDFIYTAGQFFPNRHRIEFTITDTGIGFKNCINKRFKSNLSSVQAIKWAVADGNSTKQGIPGGIGLAILKEFIVMNHGKFQIVSNDGFYQFDLSGETTRLFNGSFPGTVINMQFCTDDESSYSLSNEIIPEDLF
ncbi:MAG TPA: ATP-binding protein [bacterium]|nr:ATP-binding protein [bacterium]HPS29212.1 ATP-binding protein [bacterium]